MRTEVRTALLGQHPETDRVHRLEAELGALQARITQLALALRAPLQTPADVERILQRPPTPPVAVERRQAGRGLNHRGPDRRVSHLWDELRALLVLRWQLCSRLAATVGAPATQHLLEAAGTRLQRQGFARTPPGMSL